MTHSCWYAAALAVCLASGCSSGTPSPAPQTTESAAPAAATPAAATAAEPGAAPPPPVAPAPPEPTPLAATASELPLTALPQADTVTLPRLRSAEELLRAEAASWRNVPFRDDGTTRRGIGNAQLVRAIYRGAYDATIPDGYEEQIRTGKLVERADLAAGDLLFFEGKGFGPFRSHQVGIFLGSGQFAIATKDTGVVIARLSTPRWSEQFKTARRISPDLAEMPAFDVASYGSTEALLRDVAKAWSGTLYKENGATFDGIGNDEFIRSIYEAIYDTELEGTQKQWQVMGKSVKRADLKAGDIIFYKAGGGIGRIVNNDQRHAGMFIGNGEFVHAIRGSAVTISKLNDKRWREAYVTARRIDPDELTRAEDAREAPTAAARAVPSVARADMTVPERDLRDAIEPWKGTPYRLGGTTKSGVDCSALVRALYEEVYGVALPRTAEEQERLGTRIERRELVAGDLIFFRTQGMGPFFKSRHVGLYLGNGEFAQASGRLGVNIARLDNRYWNKKYSSARRLPKG